MTTPVQTCDVLIVGGGAGGIATAASLLKRRPDLDVRIVEPSEDHFYQPGWTLVGGGVFRPERTRRRTAELIPGRACWIHDSVAAFEPEHDRVRLAGGGTLGYRMMVASPGLKLDWAAIPGLSETLGQNGVTSNYRYDLAPYTWKLVQDLTHGRALFTQPPMPIKCAGAPQKAMYLSADHWLRNGRLKNIDVAFHNAGPVLFGVADYVPALMEYVERYDIALHFGSRLVAVDGPAGTATFESLDAEGQAVRSDREFDMLHVCPPQTAPDVVRDSALAAAAGGWVDVDPDTLRHVRFGNVFGLGDGCSSPNAKTAAAARKQAPVVAENLLAVLDGGDPVAFYDGYGSCPLTVERGKIVLAEFGYGGKLLPSFPEWMLDGKRPTRRAWHLKAQALPEIYWAGMLRGHEWLASPKRTCPPV